MDEHDTPGRARISRRMVTSGLGAVGLGAVLPLASAVPAAASRPQKWAERAEASYAALQRHLAVRDGSGLYRETYPHDTAGNPYSYEWPFSQAHAAVLDLTGMKGARSDDARALTAHGRAQQHYWSTAGSTGLPGFASYVLPPWGNGGDFFYDDNEWVGLIDVQRWSMHRDRKALAEAKRLFELVVSGWDDDPSHAKPGGVFWTQAPWSTDRNTVSNMPGAQLALRLHQITGHDRYLDWALRMYAWTNRWLQRDDGLYDDHLDLEGKLETTVWSYNQGVPTAVNVLLHEVTGERRYLREALRIAKAAQAYFGAEGRLLAQPPFFNSIYFKNLLLLSAATDRFDVRDSMADYAEQVWSTRDTETGLFRFGGATTTAMIEQAAMVQVFAVLAWPSSRYHLLY